MYDSVSWQDCIQWINISVGLFILSRAILFIAANFDHYSRVILAPWMRDSQWDSRVVAQSGPRFVARRRSAPMPDREGVPMVCDGSLWQTHDDVPVSYGEPCNCGRQVLDDHNKKVLTEERSERVAADRASTTTEPPPMRSSSAVTITHDDKLGKIDNYANSSQSKSPSCRDLW